MSTFTGRGAAIALALSTVTVCASASAQDPAHAQVCDITITVTSDLTYSTSQLPEYVHPDQTLHVCVVDTDTRRRWRVYGEGEGELASSTTSIQGVMDLLGPFIGGGALVAAAGGVDLTAGGATRWATQLNREAGSVDQSLRALADPNTQATSIPSARLEIERTTHVLQTDLTALETALTASPPPPGAQMSGLPVTPSVSGSAVQDASLLLETARVHAHAVMQRASHVQQILADNERLRNRTLSVPPGFARWRLHVCAQDLQFGDEVGLSSERCSDTTIALAIREPLSGVGVALGITIPFYASRPHRYYLDDMNSLAQTQYGSDVGNVEPTAAIAARIGLHEPTRTQIGLDLGLSISRPTHFFIIGAHVAVYGITIGTGAFFDTEGEQSPRVPTVTSGSVADRIATSLVVGPYLLITLSSDLWDIARELVSGLPGASHAEH